MNVRSAEDEDDRRAQYLRAPKPCFASKMAIGLRGITPYRDVALRLLLEEWCGVFALKVVYIVQAATTCARS